MPGAFALHPLAAAPFALLLLWTRSLTGVLGVLVASVILWPRVAPIAVLAALVAVWSRHRYPPGAITDTMRARLLTWLYLVRHLSLWGHGPRSTRLACQAASLRSGGRAMDGGPAHNEWLQFVYEYGLTGAVLLVLGAWWLAPSLAWGSTRTATVGAAVVVLACTSPLRTLGWWLRRGQEGPLFGPPMVASFTVHLDATGRVHFYGMEDLATRRASQRTVTRALFTAGWACCDQYGLTEQELADAPETSPTTTPDTGG